MGVLPKRFDPGTVLGRQEPSLIACHCSAVMPISWAALKIRASDLEYSVRASLRATAACQCWRLLSLDDAGSPLHLLGDLRAQRTAPGVTTPWRERSNATLPHTAFTVGHGCPPFTVA